MRPVLSADEMRTCDAAAVRDFGVPGLLMMENAGKGVAAECLSLCEPGATAVVIFCGKGNNGGDGLVAARHLANHKVDVTVVLFDAPDAFKGDAKKNLDIVSRIRQKGDGNLTMVRYKPSLLSSLKPTLIVDAMFGTGFSGSMPKAQSEAVQWINRQSCPVVAVDIPSGINGTDGTKGNLAVKASVTVTMGGLKLGLLCNDGRDHIGRLSVIDLGIPDLVFRQKRKNPTFMVEMSDVNAALPQRHESANKYTVGKVFVLAGSRGFTGAAALTATAVLRIGAGAAVLGTPESVYPILAKKLSEAIVVPLPSTENGSLSRAGMDVILERMEWADVTIMGPGLSRDPETQTLLQELVAKAGGNLLLDADALSAVSGNNLVHRSKTKMILTPHTGECSRLTGMSSKEIERRRVDVARNFSRKEGVTLVLKGAPTATAAMDGSVYLNSTGNPGMATVGSGDVLSGIIGGLWAQGMPPESAAWSGAFVHGLAGNFAAEKVGQQSLVAGDLIEFLPRALQSLGEED